jgi:predicted RNA-binding Zn ribbon-like protein
MPDTNSPAGNLKLIGGQLCLDFANTVDWHASDHPREYLTDYADLIAWSQHTGILSKRKAQALLQEATDRRTEADAILNRARVLREALYHIFVAIAMGKRPSADDVGQFNRELSNALPELQIIESEEGFDWDWQESRKALDQMLWPVARSAAELLTSEHLNRVRQCADTTDGCGWLFMDTSKNRTRRWCDMKDCGNRAKVRRYHNRQRRDAGIGKNRTHTLA